MARRPRDPVKDRPPINLDWFDDIVEVHWAGHPFILLQAEAFMGVSPDGVTWEKVKAPIANLFHGAFGKSAWVVSNTGFPSVQVFRGTPNAREWRRVQVPFPSGTFINGIVAGNDLIVACGGPVSGSGPPRIAVSKDDGKTWALRSLPGITTGVNTNIYSGANLSYSGGVRGKDGKFFCYGHIVTSVPSVSYRPAIGYDWTVPEVIYGPTEMSPSTSSRSVTYMSDDCENWIGPISVFPVSYNGGDGLVTFTNPINPAESVTVPATDPYPLPALESSLGVTNIANYGSPNNFLAANLTNAVSSGFAFSSDGVSWRVEDSQYRNFQGNIAGNPDGLNICSGTDNAPANGVFLASFGGGAFQASPPSEDALAVDAIPVWGKGKFVSCGFTKIITSQDGLSWTSHGNPTGSAFLHRVVY